MAVIWEKQTSPQLHLTCLGEGGNGGLCNPIPALAPVLSSPSPRHSHPISSPLPLLSPCQTPIKHPAQTAGALRWPIGLWLCREMSPAWGRQRAVSCVPPFAAATAGWQQPRHPSKTFIRLLAS